MTHSIRPRLRAEVPDGFQFKESLTILAPDRQMNVIATSEPLSEKLDAERYAQIQGDLLEQEFPDYQQLRFEPLAVFGGRPGYVRWFEWQPPPEDERPQAPVTHMQAYYAFARRGYTATATVPSFLLGHWRPVMEAIMRSLQLAGPEDPEDASGAHAA